MMEPIFKEFLHQIEENIQEIVVMTADLIEFKGIPMREEDCLMKGDIPTENGRPPRRGRSQDNGRPPMDMKDPLMVEAPNDEEP